jgi:hypothetical protein
MRFAPGYGKQIRYYDPFVYQKREFLPRTRVVGGEMKPNKTVKNCLGGLLVGLTLSSPLFAQDLPLVYSSENTGEACTKPKIPTLAEAKAYAMLPDPFKMVSGTRITKFSEWACRRAEMKAQIEGLEIGVKPPKPKDVKATFSGGTLTVTITGDNGKSITLTSKMTIPTSGTGPYPVIIGFDSPTGSLPAAAFSSRNIATMTFTTSQVSKDGTRSATNPFNVIYPDLVANGQYSAWSWGVSRLIDGLELTQEQTKIDLKHIAVSGCSRWGKGALFAAAFDERIALSLPQEAGGGGTAAWRVSETIGEVEKLGATDKNWFMQSMFSWAGSNVPKLPHDHHFLLAMIAPRAVFVIANGAKDYVWLAEESGYVSSRAGEETFKALGIPDRLGFSHSGHTHCGFPANQQEQLYAFLDKFMLGKTATTTGISTNPFASTDYNKWIADWKGQAITKDAATSMASAYRHGKGMRAFANGHRNGITLEAPGSFTYQWLNHMGQVLESGMGAGKISLKGQYQPGVYLARLSHRHESTVIKFIHR